MQVSDTISVLFLLMGLMSLGLNYMSDYQKELFKVGQLRCAANYSVFTNRGPGRGVLVL
jgi:hypothetical protein